MLAIGKSWNGVEPLGANRNVTPWDLCGSFMAAWHCLSFNELPIGIGMSPPTNPACKAITMITFGW
jgi:hypothetical protein